MLINGVINMKEKEVEKIYYNDELNDEFSGVKRNPIKIDKNFKYINKNIFYRFFRFIVYRLIMTPVAYLYPKFKFDIKYKNKKILKPFKKCGYFLYGNHTQIPSDAYIPNMISFPKDSYVVVASENVALKGTKTFMMMNGALPIPSDLGAMKHFYNALETYLKKNKAIVIYPEAHIWPFYTGIRPFKSVSFTYPIKYNDPSFAFTVTYQKRKFRKLPRITVYLDGPFYPNKELMLNEQKQDLRDQIYNKMVERSKLSTYEYIQYIKRGE